ncbi:carbohydrate ABC transporter permease [Burkholderia sp. Ac-20384]|uniref:ABC transporter permease subunit n=1 Tax=Burkholderia sp. Ac-20384 TaxID=2703902 RepID=UPI00198262C1|nr:carbohydrate ABC transporter permease [Burkholderia sp. Ac-20384]
MNVIRQRFHADQPSAGTSGGGLRASALLRRVPGFARLVAAIAIVAIVLLPTIYMVLMSLRTGDDIIARPLGLPDHVFFGNYAAVFTQMNYWRSVANTIGITLAVTFLVALLSSLAAYPLARVKGRLSNAVYIVLTLGLTIPMFVSLTPLYVLFRDLHLLNTYLGVVLAYTVQSLPLGVFFYTSFLKRIPLELEEAAVMDGCSPLQVYWYIVLPLLRPITGTLAMFVTLSVWNDLVYPLLFLTDSSKFTITVAVFRFIGTNDIDPTKLFPAAVMGTLPLLVLFFILQRKIVAGITAGAVKG